MFRESWARLRMCHPTKLIKKTSKWSSIHKVSRDWSRLQLSFFWMTDFGGWNFTPQSPMIIRNGCFVVKLRTNLESKSFFTGSVLHDKTQWSYNAIKNSRFFSLGLMNGLRILEILQKNVSLYYDSLSLFCR